MTIFGLYLELGFRHIIDLNGYDHILFITVLCGIYLISQWKEVLILITAFTVGHTTSLILATLKIIFIPASIIEFLIPVTIFITSVANIVYKKTELSKRLHLMKYLSALFFGLIHGLGFSYYLQSLLGSEESIIVLLLSFNVGLELGQIILVSAILAVSFVFLRFFNVLKREWVLVISGAGAGVSLILMLERFPF